MNSHNPFKWRHFEAEIILFCVRWYLRYALSSRDLEEMMRERGLQVDHTTLSRWVQHYAPQLEKRSRPHLKAPHDSWRVDETYIKIKKTWTLSLSSRRLARPYPGISPQCHPRCSGRRTLRASKHCTPLLLQPLKGARFRSRWPSPRLQLTPTSLRRLLA